MLSSCFGPSGSFLSGNAVIIPDRCTLAHHGQQRNSSREKTHPDWGGMAPRVCTVHFCKSSCIYYSPLQSITDSMELKFSWSCGKTRVPVAELAIPGLPQVHPCLATAEEAAGDERTPAGQQEGSAGRGVEFVCSLRQREPCPRPAPGGAGGGGLPARAPVVTSL